MILGFRPQFVPSVVDGTKPHTMRRGQRWRVGMSIQFYQGSYRQKREKFREDGEARVVQDVSIKHVAYKMSGRWKTETVLLVDGRQLTPLECQELARRDGFGDFAEMVHWFDRADGLPFTGQLIGWTDLRY